MTVKAPLQTKKGETWVYFRSENKANDLNSVEAGIKLMNLTEPSTHQAYKELTQRELEVLFYLLRGQNARDISNYLKVSIRTM